MAMCLFSCVVAAGLYPATAAGATLVIQSISCGTEATAYGAGITPYEGAHSTTSLGPYQSTDEGSDPSNGIVAFAHADLNSDASLSGNMLTVSGTANCDVSLTMPAFNVNPGQVVAESGIQIEFTIDSPFYFSIQSTATSSGQPSVVQLGKLPYLNNPFLGTSSGILPAGSYQFIAHLGLQFVGPSTNLSSANFQVTFSIFPQSELEATQTQALNGAIPTPSISNNGQTITAVFVPNGLTYEQAAALFPDINHFNWFRQ